MFPMFCRSPSGFRVLTQVSFHWFDVVEFSKFSVPFPTWQFLPTSRVLQRVELTLCASLVRMNDSASDECHHLILSDGWDIDEKHPRGIPREGGRGQVVCLAQACEVGVWRWCSCVRFVLVGASFLGVFFHFLRSWRRLHLIEGFYLNFLGGDLVRIRFFLWCKQQSPPGDPAPPRLVETLVTEGCRRKLKYEKKILSVKFNCGWFIHSELYFFDVV